jgi:hypothetical protein
MKTAIGLALLAAAAAAYAQDFPRLMPGLWEMSTTSVRREGQAPRVTSMCLDDTVQREMYTMSTGMMSGMCSRHDIKVTPGRVTATADCDLGVTKMRSQSVMTLTGNTSYRTEAHATFDPPMNGAKESTTIIEGKHVGSCKPGQQPGDMTLPGGQVINIHNLMGRKG